MKIWISYSFADKEFVSALKAQLQNDKFEVVDYDNAVMPGDNIGDAIYQSISTADTFLVILSKDGINSHSLNIETGMIISEIKNNRHKKFIPILLDTQIPIPLFLQSYKYLDFTNDKKQGKQIEQLIEMLEILNQKDVLLEKKIDEYKRQNKQRQLTLSMTLIGAIIAAFATIITFVYTSNEFFSFDIDRNIVMAVVTAAIAVFVGVLYTMILQLLKKK